MLHVQVDCAGVSLLMTGSPHTSMPYAIHHFKPRPRAGVFFMHRMCGYAQDVRYIASEHMDVRRDCVNRVQRFNKRAGAACVSFAQPTI